MKSFSDYFKFIWGVVQNPKRAGAIAETGKAVSLELIDKINFEKANLIVEIGVGGGAITKHIRTRIKSPSQYLGIEINPHFVKSLKKKFPELSFELGSAENLKEIIENKGFKEIDFVVSALPWSLLPDSLQIRILDQIKNTLVDGGGFNAIGYMGTGLTPSGRRFKANLVHRFKIFEPSRMIYENIPPGRVYHCYK